MAYSDYASFLYSPTSKGYSDCEANWKFVDSIDFMKYIKQLDKSLQKIGANNGIDIDDLMDVIEEDYKNVEKPKACQGYVFNHIAAYELATYLDRRYDGILRCSETIAYRCNFIHYKLASSQAPLPDNPPPEKKKGEKYV